MPTRSPTPEQALTAMQRIEPFLGRFSSAWCRKLLYSTLHHTAGAFDQAALKSEPLSSWLCHEPWPKLGISDIYEPLDLHWCEECLHSGYHSFAHQLVGLAYCPLHGLPIRQGCPHCEFSVLMRSSHSADSSEPFRNCMHCHKPLLQLTMSPKWPKSGKFLTVERQALLRLFHWAGRVDRLHSRVYLHSEGAQGNGQPWPTGEQYRIALETIHPLPPNIKVEPRPQGVRVTTVTLDRRSVCEAPLTREELAELGAAMVEHLGRLPVPTRWLRHWRTDEIESPVPSCAGESSHFEFWKHEVLPTPGLFRPPHPAESLRPCMLPLVGARLIGHFNQWARRAPYPGNPDPAFSILFTDLHGAAAYPPLGDHAGIIVELHNTCGPSAFTPPLQQPKKETLPPASARGNAKASTAPRKSQPRCPPDKPRRKSAKNHRPRG